MIKKCLYCQKEFDASIPNTGRGRRSRKQIKDTKFCSRECYNKSLKGYISPQTREGYRKKIKIIKQKLRESKLRTNNPNWKGGKIIDVDGYYQILVPSNYPFEIRSRYILEHRYNMEIFLKRKLQRKEIVHHIDRNKLNNGLKNLIVLSIGEHTILHRQKIKSRDY